MICKGAGTNHWFHSDLVYRSFLALLGLCGCEGVNGGGWAHYLGQEKVRPLTGWQTMAFALDWVRPPRQQATMPYLYLATDQWRYEGFDAGELASPLGRGLFRGRQFADCYALAARLGWTPAHPAFDRNPLELADAAEQAGLEPADYVVRELRAGRLRFAAEDPDAPENFPRVLTVWRANLLGSSGKGHEYFLKHLLGTSDPAVRAQESPPELRPKEVVWSSSESSLYGGRPRRRSTLTCSARSRRGRPAAAPSCHRGRAAGDPMRDGGALRSPSGSWLRGQAVDRLGASQDDLRSLEGVVQRYRKVPGVGDARSDLRQQR